MGMRFVLNGFGYITIATIGLIVFSIIDGIKGDEYLTDSINWSLAIKDIGFFKVWMWPFTHLFFQAANLWVYIGLFMMKDKALAFWLFYFKSLETLLQNLIKLAYFDTRPCFLNQELADMGCSCSFGKISGHASTTFFFYLFILTEYLLPLKRKVWLKILFSFLTIVMIFFVGMSRIFYGSHSWNQVLLGWFWGFWIWALSRSLWYYFGEDFIVFIESGYDKKTAKVWFLLSGFLSLLGLTIASIVLWRVRVDNELSGDFQISTSCFEKCMKNDRRMSDSHIQSIGNSEAAMSITFLWLFFDLAQTIYNQKFYSESFRPFLAFLTRFTIFLIVGTPVIIAFSVSGVLKGDAQFGFSMGLSLIFAILFLKFMPWALTRVKVGVSGDWFLGNPFAAGGKTSDAEMKNFVGLISQKSKDILSKDL